MRILTFSSLVLFAVLVSSTEASPKNIVDDSVKTKPEFFSWDYWKNTAHDWGEKRKQYYSYNVITREGDNGSDSEKNCSQSSDDFPAFLTIDEVKQGGIVLVVCVGIYCFTFLAVICDEYFLPCVERFCQTLNLAPDVAAATFMSTATTTPEFFTNVIGTFITKSDLGIGTVVGSSMFNSLGVAALGGIFASVPLQLAWWPVTRDIIIYIISIFVLVAVTWDGYIFWYEGLVLFLIYVGYYFLMFNSHHLSNFVLSRVERRKNKKDIEQQKQEKIDKKLSARISGNPRLSIVSMGSYVEEPVPPVVVKSGKQVMSTGIIDEDDDDDGSLRALFQWPEGSIWGKIFFCYLFPLKFFLRCVMLDPRRHRKLFPITFVLCIVFIGCNAYMVSWMITIIGATFQIPDSVLGLTFLAAGGCLPEGTSITILARKGIGAFGVSNSLGANTMNILMSLGLPWFLKTITMGTNDDAFIVINSNSLEYTIVALLVVAICLYVTLFFNKFVLYRRTGIILISIYAVAAVLAVLAEMVFFKSDDGC